MDKNTTQILALKHFHIYIYIHIAFLVPVVPHMLRISHFGSVSRSAVSRLDLRTGTGMG